MVPEEMHPFLGESKLKLDADIFECGTKPKSTVRSCFNGL
jgi:hypothetical protein